MKTKKLKVGQDVWLTEQYDYIVHHAKVVRGLLDGYYLIQYDDSTNPEMLPEDAQNCFVSASSAYNYLMRICRETVKEARREYQSRLTTLWEIKRDKKNTLKGIR